MCDFSLQAFKSRPAKVGDRLVTRNFGSGTTGFAEANSTDNTAICVMPGTEMAFDEPFKTASAWLTTKKYSSVAIFRQINKDQTHMHHDALETPSGERVMLTHLSDGQYATVLQLPAAPKTEQEAKDQERLAISG